MRHVTLCPTAWNKPMKTFPVSGEKSGTRGCECWERWGNSVFCVLSLGFAREFSAGSFHKQRCLAYGFPSEHPFPGQVWEARGTGTAAGEAGGAVSVQGPRGSRSVCRVGRLGDRTARGWRSGPQGLHSAVSCFPGRMLFSSLSLRSWVTSPCWGTEPCLPPRL